VKRALRAHDAFLGAVFFCAAAGGVRADSITVHGLPDNRTAVLESTERGGETFADLSTLCGLLGAPCGPATGSVIECRSAAHSAVLLTDNPFLRIDGRLYQMPCAPLERHGALFLPVHSILEIFSRVFACSLACAPYPPEPVAVSESWFEKSRQNQNIKVIVIDPGHGGRDPGAIGPQGTYEKDIVLGISLKLYDMLKSNDSLETYITRKTDVYVPLLERTRFANEKKADLFLSIHANSIGGSKKRKKTIQGFKVYFLSQAKNEEDKLVAMQENAVIELDEETAEGSDHLQNILINLAGNEYLRESQELSIIISEAFETALSGKMSRLHLGVGQANFLVLNGVYMPSVLVETGFISNPKEEKLLTDAAFQKKVAKAIYKAVFDFKKKFEAAQ
jgi:N-acetylmuramoyl-L-alanine amidase